jgi:NADH:ubiquinone oxidoreductase subunit 3 (subunit A)
MYSGEYGGVLLGLALCLVLAIVFAGLSYIVSAKQADVEKVSAYECGFDPFDDTRKTFDVRFYLVAILFLIFDLEVSFLFPWVVSLGTLPLLGFWSMILFLVILTVGFIYEWRKGALDW